VHGSARRSQKLYAQQPAKNPVNTDRGEIQHISLRSRHIDQPVDTQRAFEFSARKRKFEDPFFWLSRGMAVTRCHLGMCQNS
jgi:hypothetical protein